MKKTIYCLVVAAGILILLPWLSVTFAAGADMLVLLGLLFIVNPLYFAISGIFAGSREKVLWWIPFISAAMFFIGAWLFVASGEATFIIYMLVYLAIGMAAMLVTVAFRSGWYRNHKY